jgi:prepilin-type N-terminal cleavage/methylation domain-containing protein
VGRLREEGGYSLVELLTVMAILSVVLTGLTTLFVSGSNAQLDQNRRFEAQQAARVAMDTLKRDAHCSTAALPGTTSSTVILANPCVNGGYVSWCTATVTGTTWYALYRSASTTCNSSGASYGTYFTTGSVFTYTQQSTQSLANLHVDLPVNLRSSAASQTYRLVDDIALRNSGRTCVVASPSDIGSPSPPC